MRDLLPKIEELSPVYALPVLALFVSFVALVIWVYRQERTESYRRAAEIPFDHE